LEQRYDERVLEYVDREILGKYDRNGNRILDHEEWEGVAWGDDPRTDDKDGDSRLTREELAGRMARRWGYGEKRPGASSGPTSGGQGFSVSVGGNPGGMQRIREYAESMMRKYDENKNGMLEQDEWKQMGGGDHGAADRNGDGRLSLDELTLRFSGGGERRGDRDERRRDGDVERKSYRALTAVERLPKGIPDWFTKKDANADGQVAMAEYGTSWSDSELAEFQKWDVNNDGYITPDECVPKTKLADRAETTRAAVAQLRAAEDQARMAEFQVRAAQEMAGRRERMRDRERRGDDDGDRRSGRNE
jgi:hypothetical protein